MRTAKGAKAGGSKVSGKKNPKDAKSSTKGTNFKSKPQFKSKNNAASTSKESGKRKSVRNHFTFAEEKRLDRIREQNERKAEKEAKKLQAKKEKRRKLKILSKKNRKGQPVMKGRMELLLEKIEKRL